MPIELEKASRWTDPYFIEKKLYPNIDFYSGITLKALGFPTSMFTVLFALARTVGWIAQWKEMLEDPHQKIGRPRPDLYRTHRTQLCPGGQAVTDKRAAFGAALLVQSPNIRFSGRASSMARTAPAAEIPACRPQKAAGLMAS